MRVLTRRVHILLISLSVLISFSAAANPEREFIMSCTYGVLAGTLVGAATLAFVDQPGENLQYVARGASIGLYMGIGLGYYTAYVLPKQIQRDEEQRLEDSTSEDSQSWLPKLIFPVASQKGVDGVGAVWQINAF